MRLNRIIKPILIFCTALILLSANICISATLEVGDKAPSFKANDQNGNLWSSDDFFGKRYLVVYFYPAAMTGGCTKQACGFRDEQPSLSEYDVEVVGVSGDAVKNLKYFEQAHNLNFTLLSDVSGDIAEKFGIPTGEGGSIVREIDGEQVTLSRAVTTGRWTFIIDKTGKVVFKNTDVDAANDSKSVIKFLSKSK